MIPLTLSLRNFLSYGTPTHCVDFEPYYLVCLSGKNGHGKSALLDAMTWALWGNARKLAGIARSDDALMRQGCTEMLVGLDFMSNNQRYRVRRTYTTAGSKQHMTLDVASITSDGTVMAALTEKTIRATQATLDQIIGIDYEGFIASAYIRQGNAHEFSKKSAKERKELIANLLGIAQYETLRTQALEHARLCSYQVESLTRQSDQLKTQGQHAKMLMQQVAQIDENIQLVTTQQQELHLQLELVRTQAQQARVYEQLVPQQSTALQDAYTQRKQAVLQAYALSRHKGDLESRDIHQQVALLESLDQQWHTLTQEQERHNTWTQTHAQYQQVLKLKQAESVPYAQRIDHVTQLLAQYPDIPLHDTIQRQFAKRKHWYQAMLAKRQTFIQKRDQLNTQIPVYHEESVCPVCCQSVPEHNKSYVAQWHARHIHHIDHQLNRLNRILPLLKQLLQDQHTLIEHRAPFVQQMAANEQNLLRHAQIRQEIESCQQALFAHELIRPRNPEPDLQAIGQRMHITRQRITRATAQQQDHVDWHRLTARRMHMRQQVRTLTDTLRTQRRAWTLVQDAPAREKKFEHDIALLDNQLKTLHMQSLMLRKETGIAQTAEKEYAHLQEKVQELQEDLRDYQTLAHAYSRDGIQALLIEQALPDIEREANAILSDLTDNQTHIMFESIKDLKSGKLKETLDIHISDHMGIRSYDLFSGGEAFRIDFALRIGLAKFVSHKAGTRLQTLIIDEGFGSQDEEGLGHLMDALHKIQTSFEKIIIVSHLPHLKDQFPVHFMVHKGAQGSTVQVVQHG